MSYLHNNFFQFFVFISRTFHNQMKNNIKQVYQT